MKKPSKRKTKKITRQDFMKFMNEEIHKCKVHMTNCFQSEFHYDLAMELYRIKKIGMARWKILPKRRGAK